MMSACYLSLSTLLSSCLSLDLTSLSHLLVISILILTAIYVIAKLRPENVPVRTPVSSTRIYTRGVGVLMKCTSPSTGETIITDDPVHAYTPEDVKQAYQRAKIASSEWKETTHAERRQILGDILEWTITHQSDIITWSTRDSGKTMTEAALGEGFATVEKLRWTIQYAERSLAREYRPLAFLMSFTKKAYVDYHPMGVIGVIVPWNYPYHNVVSAVAAALAAGNGCVIKVSEYSSASASDIEMMFRTILATRGYNPDLIQVITGYAETGAALVNCGVDKVLFIGSPAVGRHVMRAASTTLTPVILELGGKDPFIIFEDVDFNHMLDIALRGAFINAGQNCISSERFYVHTSIHDRFIDAVVNKLSTCAWGISNHEKRTDWGAITMPTQIKHYNELIQDAVSKGANIVHGGISHTDADAPSGCFFTPTVLTNVTHDMRISREECFGPIMTVIRFEKEDELLSMVNSTEFGLGSSVFTTDYRRAERIASKIQSGMVTINDFGMVPILQSLPFGGIRSSGFGCFNGPEGLRGFSRAQSVVTDRWGIRAQTPSFLQYPVARDSHILVQHAIRLVYSRSWLTSIRALIALIRRETIFVDKRNSGKDKTC